MRGFKVNISICLLAFLLSIFSAQGNDPAYSDLNYGLYFNSHTVNQDKRTSLSFRTDNSLRISDGFAMEFELSLRKEDLAYGYVFRIISDKVSSLDLVSNINTNKLNFILIDRDEIVANSEFADLDLKPGEWISIGLKVDLDSIRCTVNELSHTIPYSFGRVKERLFIFGKNEHSKFYSTDVVPMSIKNLIIRNADGKVVRSWKLHEHNLNEVYDDIHNSVAVVQNGIWEIDTYIQWNRVMKTTLGSRSAPQVAYDNAGNRFFVASTDSIHIYNLNDKSTEGIKVTKGAPFWAGGTQMLYDSKHSKLISYSVKFDDFVNFDFRKKEWSATLQEGFPPIQNHSRQVVDNMLIVFGGYGNHQYHSELAIHDLDGHEWEIVSLDGQIPPRYLSGMGYRNDGKLLILGGYGSLSGKQEEFPHNFNNIYEIDLKTSTARKITELPDTPEPRVFAPSMHIDEQDNRLYALAYNNSKHNSSLRLLSIDLTTFEQTLWADPIPYKFVDTDSYCDLVFNNVSRELTALVLERHNPGMYSLQIYSLSYPPLSRDDVLQSTDPSVGASLQDAKTNYLLAAVIALIVLMLLAGGGYLVIKRNKKQNALQAIPVDNASGTVIKNIPVQTKPRYKVNLLGGFQVFDKDDKDITGSFTPIIRQLFLFILLHSVGKGKGVSSTKIDEVIWFGMDKTSASNNRSVNLRKLRLLLKDIGNIAVVNENSYWSVSIEEPVNCDYSDILNMISVYNTKGSTDLEALRRIVDIASSGMPLPSTVYDWIDDFKSGYTYRLISLLKTEISKVGNNPEFILEMAEIILMHDSLDEDAIRLKCRTLNQLGHKGVARRCYDKFVAEYRNMLKTEFKSQFEDIIS